MFDWIVIIVAALVLGAIIWWNAGLPGDGTGAGQDEEKRRKSGGWSAGI
jgi:hypothetical protein